MIVDAGGLAVAGGGRVRRGRLFRVSGGIAVAADLERLGNAGVRTLIDLRGTAEDREMMQRWAAETGARYVALPIAMADAHDLMRAINDAPDAAGARVHMRTLYTRIVDENGPQLASAVRTIAKGSPVAFGCAAGKDRTGILAALVHRVLGVGVADAAASYAASPPGVAALRPVLRDGFGYDEAALARPGVEVLLGAEPALMEATLAHVDAEHGDVAAYLLAHGATPAELQALRDDLVEAV